VSERLVEREVLGQLDGEGERATLVGLRETDDTPESSRLRPSRIARVPTALARGVLVVVPGEPGQRANGVARAGDDVEDHRVVDLHPGDQRLGGRRDELVEGRLVPDDLACLGLDPLHPFELEGIVAALALADERSR
jgi:hypothetical protein